MLSLTILLLSACGAKDNIQNVAGEIPQPLHFMAKFMMAINKSVPNFSLTIIIFTISLRLILLPFDIWQQIIMVKNNKKMKKMKPELEALQTEISAITTVIIHTRIIFNVMILFAYYYNNGHILCCFWRLQANSFISVCKNISRC